MNPRLLLALIVFCLPGVSSAQNTNTDGPPPTFRIISACGSYTGLMYDMKVGGKKITVPVTLNQSLSVPLPRPPNSTLELYRVAPPPPGSPPGATFSRAIMAKVDLSSYQSDFIIVTFPSSEARNAPLHARIVPAASDSHVAGTLRLVNFSNAPAGVAIGETQHILQPGDSGLISCGAGRALLQVAVKKQDGWVSAFRGERRMAAQLRGYVFVFNYMVDPDYGADALPPPATVKTFFEASPETLAPTSQSRH